MQLGHANTRVTNFVQRVTGAPDSTGRLDSWHQEISKGWIAASPEKPKHPTASFTLVTGCFWVRHQGFEPRTR